MRFLAIFLLFCFAVAGGAFLAKVGMREEVEEELRRKSLEVLADAGFGGVEVSFDHLDGRLGGTVDRPEDIAAVVALLRDKVPAAYWPETEAAAIGIRPTLPPEILLSRPEGSDAVRIEGRLSIHEDAGRSMLGARLHALSGVEKVENTVRLDPMVLAFPQMAELASLASELFSHPGEVKVGLREGTLSLSGTVPNEGLKRSLLDLAGRTGATEVEDAIQVQPPATFSRLAELKVTRNRFGITLGGILPSEADREALRGLFAKAQAGPLANDRLEVDGGCGKAAWQDWIGEIAPLMMDALRGEMTAEFTSTQTRISGVAADESTRQALLERLASLKGEGETLEPAIALATDGGAATRSAVAMEAVYEGGLLVLSGSLPAPGFAAALEAELEKVLPDVSVKDELETVPAGSGDAWIAGVAGFFVETLPRLEMGKFTLGNGTFDIEGRTLSLPDRQTVQNLAVNVLPADFKIRNRLLHPGQAFPKPALLPEERTRIAESLKAFPIYFDKNSEALKEEESGKLASMAGVLKEASGRIDLLVTGVSDNVGNSERNKQLSLLRAESVRRELVRLGVPEANLSLEAVEEDVSRVARSEQWKSRRVEVSLKPAATAAP